MPFYEACQTLSVKIRYRTITVEFLKQQFTYEVRFGSVAHTGLVDLFVSLTKAHELPKWQLQHPVFSNPTVELDTAAIVCGWNFSAYVDLADHDDILSGHMVGGVSAWIRWYNEDQWTCLVMDSCDVERVIGGALRWIENMNEVDDKMRARRQHQG